MGVAARKSRQFVTVMGPERAREAYEASRWTDCGENAGTHTATYSAPPGSGVDYCTHSQAVVTTA